jgi:threonine/homoserine/homoserine lactone efflux protein
MSHDTLFAFLIFAFATSVTPGPVNILLMSSGVNHGFRGTLPHLWGVSAGFALVLLLAGLGLHELFIRYPQIYAVMRWGSVLYFGWFAWKLASAPAGPMEVRSLKPWRFHEGMALPFLNPKAWLMAAAAFSSYVPANSGNALVSTMALLFALIAIPCFVIWVLFGSRLRQYLAQGQRRRVFNIGMAILLLASLVPLLA